MRNSPVGGKTFLPDEYYPNWGDTQFRLRELGGQATGLAGQYGQYVGPVANFASGMLPDDPYRVDASDTLNVLGDTASGAYLGFKAGSAVPVVGPLIGGLAGGAIGLGKGIYDEYREGKKAREQIEGRKSLAIDTIREQAEVTAEARKMAGERIKTEMSNRRTGMNRGLTGGAVQDTALRGRANIDQGTASDIAQIQAQADMAIAQMMREDDQLDQQQATQRFQNLYNAVGPASFQLLKFLTQSKADTEADETTKLQTMLLERLIKGLDSTTVAPVGNPATDSVATPSAPSPLYTEASPQTKSFSPEYESPGNKLEGIYNG
jgi:hypothetical protein